MTEMTQSTPLLPPSCARAGDRGGGVSNRVTRVTRSVRGSFRRVSARVRIDLGIALVGVWHGGLIPEVDRWMRLSRDR
jgi:hypothetical protein